MTSLIKIGNSQGIRLPKAIIKQAHLENATLEFEVLENGLLIKPLHPSSRKDWEDNIKNILHAQGHDDEALLRDLLDDSDLDDAQW